MSMRRQLSLDPLYRERSVAWQREGQNWTNAAQADIWPDISRRRDISRQREINNKQKIRLSCVWRLQQESFGYATWNGATGTGSELDENVCRNTRSEAKSANNEKNVTRLPSGSDFIFGESVSGRCQHQNLAWLAWLFTDRFKQESR